MPDPLLSFDWKDFQSCLINRSNISSGSGAAAAVDDEFFFPSQNLSVILDNPFNLKSNIKMRKWVPTKSFW